MFTVLTTLTVLCSNQIFTFFVHECADGKQTQALMPWYTSGGLTSSATCWGVCCNGSHRLKQTESWWLKLSAKSGVKKVIYNIQRVWTESGRKGPVAAASTTNSFWKHTCKVCFDYSEIYIPTLKILTVFHFFFCTVL